MIKRDVLFQGLFDFAPDAIIIVNSEGRIIQVNTQTEKIFGYQRDELIGRSVDILIPERFKKRHNEHLERYISKPHTAIPVLSHTNFFWLF